MTLALGLVMNPKLAQPLLVEADGRSINILRMDAGDDEWLVEGEGHLDPDDEAATITGFPEGWMARRGEGYGTALYTALCLAAHQNHEAREGATVPRYQLIPTLGRYGAEGDGISSMEGNRSSDADIWWQAATERKLAYHIDEEQTEQDVDATRSLRNHIDGESVDEGTVGHVNNINVDVSREVHADIYEWERARAKNLILADFTIDLGDAHPATLWRKLQADQAMPGGGLVDIEIPWIMALDVRGLTLESINLLGILAQVAGASEDDLDHLRLRWELQLDPTTPITQMRLPFKANSSEARAAHDAVEQARELRQASGWASLAGLP